MIDKFIDRPDHQKISSPATNAVDRPRYAFQIAADMVMPTIACSKCSGSETLRPENDNDGPEARIEVGKEENGDNRDAHSMTKRVLLPSSINDSVEILDLNLFKNRTHAREVSGPVRRILVGVECCLIPILLMHNVCAWLCA